MTTTTLASRRAPQLALRFRESVLIVTGGVLSVALVAWIIWNLVSGPTQTLQAACSACRTAFSTR